MYVLYNTDTMGMNIEAESLSALSSVDRLDYSSVNDSTLQCCVVHDGASDDRADKCSISGYYHHRKQHLAVHTTTTDEQCKFYVCMHVKVTVYWERPHT